MKISKKDWQNYIARLRKINETAANKVTNFMQSHDCSTPEGVKLLIDYAHAVSTKYGEGAAELSCQMLDAVAEASQVYVPAAEPAATATYGEIAKTIYGTLASTQDPNAIGAAVGRSVKLASLDTLQQNALRDGAEWAWIPSGDTCPFCIMLASNGWQKASKKAIKNGHAEHIHNNCDCIYCVRYDGETTVEGYDPDALYEQYVNAGDTPRERLNALRRQHYAANRLYINAQKRAAYERRRQLSYSNKDSVTFKRKRDIVAHKTTDGKYGIYVSEDATLKKQGLNNIEKAIENALESLDVPKDSTLPQIIVLSDREMGDSYAAYNYVDNRLYLRDSMGNKRSTISYQRKLGFADPDDPHSTAKHELIHWLDAEEYRRNNADITKENASEYLRYRNEQSKIYLDNEGINESNVHTISKYASEQYILANDYDEAFTEFRVLRR